jgi:DNA-binding response OmpR family regulator
MQVLIVEDEQALREGLTDLLSAAGHEVTACEFGREAISFGTERPFDLVLLDLMLPDIDGVEVCRRLRRARPTLHILMLTARGSEDDKVAGLEAGADDYLTKPFAVRELLARINALGRRAAGMPADPEILEADGCLIDLGRLQAQRGHESVSITPREAGILRWLHRHRARAVSRAELLERIWGSTGDLQTRTVDMTIANLRQKIERDPSEPRILVTVTGAGYAWGGEHDT